MQRYRFRPLEDLDALASERVSESQPGMRWKSDQPIESSARWASASARMSIETKYEASAEEAHVSIGRYVGVVISWSCVPGE